MKTNALKESQNTMKSGVLTLAVKKKILILLNKINN